MPFLIITCSKVYLIVLSFSAVIPKLVISYMSFRGSIVLAKLYYAVFVVYRCRISRPIVKNSLVF